jgi:glutamyl-tRNA synthetase
VFFVRLEDTDTKREIAGAGENLLNEMKIFKVYPDEGYLGDSELGDYGPYKQSERALIYKTVIKQMIKDDLAYPCFCTTDDLALLRATQEASKVVSGYYGHYATCSKLSADEAIAKIEAGVPYVIRFRSKGNHENRVTFDDEVKGTIEIAENDQHIVILKSDGLPTYHFAHVCDDHFMRTTLVSRGEEWISSVPLHLEMFAAVKFNQPRYAHLPTIDKLDDGNKRKLSKRRDPEAAVTYFLELGYPVDAVLTYLMSIANSNFEEWWAENREKPLSEFPFSISKMSVVGALFDIEKVNFFAREYIASLTAKEVVDEYLAYALYNKNEKLVKRIKDNYDLFVQILNIEREGEKPRKDYHNYSMVYPSIKFFFSDEFAAMHEDFDIGEFKESLSKDTLIGLLESFKTELTYGEGNSVWFDSLKKVAEKHGFAINNKAYRTNPELYNGNVADCAEVLRLAIVLSKKSLNLYEVLSILGPKEVEKRLTAMQNKLK